MKLVERLFNRPAPNVGHGDLFTRLVALLVLVGLILLVLPHGRVEFHAVKISLLAAAEVGLIILMLGLFLDTKTHCAGLLLFVGALVMFALARRQLPWPAVAVGLVFVAGTLVSVVSRRSRFNQAFNLSSIREVIESTP